MDTTEEARRIDMLLRRVDELWEVVTDGIIGSITGIVKARSRRDASKIPLAKHFHAPFTYV